uniref:hypothetical protein n=1 Tax=Roseburia inulinivorans TaxID=360807 RepID=UPI004028B2D0
VTGLTPASVVQLRWTHNVTERKTVQTNMISFVSHGAGILTIMEASAEHDCCSEAQRNARRTGTSYLSVPFFFS